MPDPRDHLSPAGFEQYFRDLAALGGPLQASPEQFAELLQRYGFESRPETIPELLQRFGLRLSRLRGPRGLVFAPPHAVALPLAHAAIGTHRAAFGNAPPQPCYLLISGQRMPGARGQTNVRRQRQILWFARPCSRCYDFLFSLQR